MANHHHRPVILSKFAEKAAQREYPRSLAVGVKMLLAVIFGQWRPIINPRLHWNEFISS